MLQEEYRTRYPKGLIPITGVDNAFAFHGFIVASILCLQSNRYPGADKKLSTTAKVTVIFCIIVPNMAYFLEMLGFIQWLDVIYVHRFEEWLLLFVRYLPQVMKPTNEFSLNIAIKIVATSKLPSKKVY